MYYGAVETLERIIVATIEELMLANLLEVFNERDPQARQSAIARTYVPGVRFFDPDEVVEGHEALDAKAGSILDGAPGFVFSPSGPIRTNHDLGYLEWSFGPTGQPPVVKGLDIALVADGKITTVYTLLLTEPS